MRYWPAFVSLTLLVLYLLPQNLWMGDGFSIMRLFQEKSLLEVIKLDDGLFFISPIPVALAGFGVPWQVLSMLAGCIWFYYAVHLTRLDSSCGVLFLLPLMQLFNGYIELYPLVYAFSLATYYYYVTNRPRQMVIAFGLAFCSHFLIAAPLLVLVGMDLWRKDELVAVTLGAVTAAYILFAKYTFVRPDTLFPLTGYYSLFSSEHLTEIAALLFGSCSWAVLSFSRPHWKGVAPELYLTAAAGLAIMLVIQPQLGMLRDWDLMSMAILPLTFVLLTLLPRITFASKLWAAAVLAAFLWFNHSPRNEVMTGYMEAAPQYSAQYRNGYIRNISAYVMNKEVNRRDLTARILRSHS